MTASSLTGREISFDDREMESATIAAQKVAVLQGHHGAVTAISFSADGPWLATAGVDRII